MLLKIVSCFAVHPFYTNPNLVSFLLLAPPIISVLCIKLNHEPMKNTCLRLCLLECNDLKNKERINLTLFETKVCVVF